jgi:hypothetical protein
MIKLPQLEGVSMADQPSHPPEDLPVIFADGIANFANSPEIFKFYLFRQDPSITGEGLPESRAAAQCLSRGC